jgi:hypothetical protein
MHKTPEVDGADLFPYYQTAMRRDSIDPTRTFLFLWICLLAGWWQLDGHGSTDKDFSGPRNLERSERSPELLAGSEQFWDHMPAFCMKDQARAISDRPPSSSPRSSVQPRLLSPDVKPVLQHSALSSVQLSPVPVFSICLFSIH